MKRATYYIDFSTKARTENFTILRIAMLLFNVLKPLSCSGLANIKHGCFKTVLKHCFIFNKTVRSKVFLIHVHVIDVDRQNEQFYKMSNENEELLLKNY